MINYKYKTIMGVVVEDSLQLDNGVIITEYYVRLREVDIINQIGTDGMYQLVGTFDYYANEKARDEDKEKIKYEYKSIGSRNLTNVHEQLYTALKSDLKEFRNV